MLLDVLTTGGPGGYWPELWGGDGKLYIVFPVPDRAATAFASSTRPIPPTCASSPTAPLPGAASMYIQFQDEFAFMGGHKVDMRTFESVLHLDGENVARPNQPGVVGIDTSQFLLPLGNLLVTGGIGENEGMAIWAHQAAPDTRGPSVGYHIPQAGRTQLSASARRSACSSTRRWRPRPSSTARRFIVRRARRRADRRPPHLLLRRRADLRARRSRCSRTPTYEVVLPAGGIKDAAGNGIVGYSFTLLDRRERRRQRAAGGDQLRAVGLSGGARRSR